MKRLLQSGLTLLELVIALSMLALVATLALPSFGAMTERARLRGAAETLAADLAEARFESARSGRAVFVVPQTAGAAWCWAVTFHAGCGCQAAASCQLKTVRSGDHAGVDLVEASASQLDPSGRAPVGGGALFRSSHGEQLKVDMMPLGRARVCSPGGSVPSYPAC